jgi:lactate dehydrogenase-like 2-hydroxyacid dehydrogenase
LSGDAREKSVTAQGLKELAQTKSPKSGHFVVKFEPLRQAANKPFLEDVFRRSDFVSVSCPPIPETRHLVNADRPCMARPGRRDRG